MNATSAIALCWKPSSASAQIVVATTGELKARAPLCLAITQKLSQLQKGDKSDRDRTVFEGKSR